MLVHDASRLHERSRLFAREGWEPEVGTASFQNALYSRIYGRLKVSTDQRRTLASTPLFGGGNCSSHSENCATNQGVALKTPLRSAVPPPSLHQAGTAQRRPSTPAGCVFRPHLNTEPIPI